MEPFELGTVRTMSWDHLSGEDSRQTRLRWQDVETRIRELETPEFTYVLLEGADSSVLTVAGDRQHGYLAFVSKGGIHHYVMAPEDRRSGKETIVIGAQPGEFAKRILVDLETALSVAHFFFKTGNRDPSVEWTQDDSWIA